MKIGLVTLGCDKNTVDNEYLAGVMTRRGHSVEVADGQKARYDALIITTCGFIEAATAQSMMEIDYWARQKRDTGHPRRLIVAGCLTQVRAEEILHAFPEVDGIAGVGNIELLADLIEQADPHSAEVCLALHDIPDMHMPSRLPRRKLQDRPYAYLKIADGCDHRCAFCSIPLIKGAYASVDMEMLVDEARALLERGVREINIIGQDISLYGRDLQDAQASLARLLKRLAALDGDFWLRLLYLYPSGLSQELFDLMAEEPKICPYLDVPLQHLDPAILKSMNRPAGQLSGSKLVEHIRKTLPGATLRTTFIVGLPGETDQAFETLLQGVKELQFDRLGAFIYSAQPGTPACTMAGQVPDAVAQERFDRLMRAQQEIHFAKSAARVGQQVRVLFEGRDRDKAAAIARSQAEAPEIDGYIYVKGASPRLSSGFGEVAITRADGYDLWAEVCAND